jgi:predicted TIM-barrel fold metal-dependent hydrolase
MELLVIDKQSALARIVGVEEHVAFPELNSRLPEAAVVEKGYFSRDAPFGRLSLLDKMSETEQRLTDLDAVGQSVQVLSLPLAGGDVLPPQEAAHWSREANDRLARRIAAHSSRYAALANLPLTDPKASADELERTIKDLDFKGALVNGATQGLYLDHSSFEPVLARAEHLDVPIYLHPAPSSRPVREALYGGLPDDLGFWMSVSGWGWHADTAVHVMRLLLSGAFQRHPGLKVIIGHLGEGLQVMMPRLDQQFHTFAGFEGVPSELLRKHVWVSTGGFFHLPSFMAALDAFGPDRMLYSVDYPFGSLKNGRAFLDNLPVDADILSKLTHQNADRLFRLEA